MGVPEDSEQENEQRYRETYCMYLTSGEGGGGGKYHACQVLNEWLIEKHAKHLLKTLVLFQLCHVYMRKDTRLSPT